MGATWHDARHAAECACCNRRIVGGEVSYVFEDEETGLEMSAEGQASRHKGVPELGLLGMFEPVGTGETLTGGAATE